MSFDFCRGRLEIEHSTLHREGFLVVALDSKESGAKEKMKYIHSTVKGCICGYVYSIVRFVFSIF